MDKENFIDLVEKMRSAQKEYFKSRNRNALQRSIMLEGVIDKEIKLYKEQRANKELQLNLFPNNKK